MDSTDREILVALHRATRGANWKQDDNWDTDANLSSWYGVKVDDEGHVVKLSLKYNNLQGLIPAEIGALMSLGWLDVSDNFLCGEIPREIGNLTSLTWLDISDNRLSAHAENLQVGCVLQKLQECKLSHRILWLEFGSVPEELAHLKALIHLQLTRNNLEGVIPASLGQLGNLQKLDLSFNKLGGQIPGSLRQLANLVGLHLNNNELSGPIPKELGDLRQLRNLYLSHNQLTGTIPTELGKLTTLTHLYLHETGLADAPKQILTGGALARWLEKLRGAGRTEPLAISVVDFLVALWHFLVPIFDDVTDVVLLLATFKDRGGLWWACCGAFVLADVERVLLFLVTWLLMVCWVPFALLATDESRGERFKVLLKCLNGWHELRLERVFVGHDDTGVAVWGSPGSALRWPILDGFLWVVIGSRSKSSSLMTLFGMAGNTPVDALEQSGFGLSLIDRIVHHHPYSSLGSALFSYPHGHHLPGSGMATRRSWVMLRAVGETLVVDSLFFSLSLSHETWEDGVSIGIFSLIFSGLELLTELQYYAAEAREDMVTAEEERTGAETIDGISMEAVNNCASPDLSALYPRLAGYFG